jgi:MYXO-CTERM domain-containing protein
MRTWALLLTLSALPSAVSASTEGDPGSTPEAPSTPDVVGGRQAPDGKWNDAAGAMASQGYALCTGTLIAPNLVITAGHCIGEGITSVKLGVNDYEAAGGEEIAVTREVEYPNSQSTYDVGLLFLAESSSYTPRAIASGCVVERSLHDGAPVHIVGYGAIDEQGNNYTSELREAESTVTDADCGGGRGCNGTVYPGGELAAGGDGVDACFGDSGGPLYLDDTGGIFLVGVTSRGYYDTDLPCSEGGIWVRPDAVMDWIESTAEITLPRSVCPTADSLELEVEAGEVVSTAIHLGGGAFPAALTLATGAPAAHGDIATENDGSIHYRAHDDYEGPDTFSVQVKQNGVPTGGVTFTVMVVPNQGGGCGCRAGGRGAPGSVVLIGFALAFALRRRRG